MKIIDVQQGSPEWHAARSKTRNASHASSMMGASKKMPRNDLIRVLATGVDVERSEWVENVLFARGHEVEAAARAHAEKIVGDDLYPVVATDKDGYLGASFDGLTMDGRIAWENKQWNEEKAAIVRAGQVPDEDRWQVIQQLVISDAERLLYMVTDGTPERTVYCWVDPPSHRDVAKLMAGWKQLDEDVKAYVPTEAPAEKPKAQIESLPAVAVQVNGAIAIVSNLDVFGTALKDFIGRINQQPNTDEEFAAAEAAITTMEKAETALSAAKASGLAQVATVDEMVRTVDTLSGLARSTRLTLEKVVKQRKDQIRLEIVAAAKSKLGEHILAINKRLAPVALPAITADFAGVIKGKKTVTSVRNAADTELARAKIEANEIAEKIGENLRLLEAHAEHRFLFNDLSTIAHKAPDDFATLVKSRIAEHVAAEEARQQAERDRIREEEAARAKREADAKIEQARVEIRAEEQEKAREEVQQPVAQAERAAPRPADPILARRAAREPVTIEAPRRPSSADLYRAPLAAAKTEPGDSMPGASAIVTIIARHYDVNFATALSWIKAADFAAVVV